MVYNVVVIVRYYFIVLDGMDSHATSAMTDVNSSKMASSGKRVPACVGQFFDNCTFSSVTKRWRAMRALCYEREGMATIHSY